jgi:hypothetical protein
MSKAVKIRIYKMIVKPVVVCGSETWPMIEMGMKRQYMGEENIKEGIWTSDRTRNMENKS